MHGLHQTFVKLLTRHRPGRRVRDGLLTLGMLAAAAPLPAATQAFQALAEIEATAEAFLKDSGGPAAEAQASALDRRLKLPRCDQPLAAFLRAGARVQQRTIVGVRCTGSRPWKVYVPVSLVVKEEVLVTRGNLPRGHQLTVDDVTLERRDVSRVPGGYLTRPAEVVGQRLKQSLRAGAIVAPTGLVARTVVRRGQSVTLAARSDAINIRMAGKAMMDGALHQRIRVQNVNSGRVVEGIVRSPELVEVLVQ